MVISQADSLHSIPPGGQYHSAAVSGPYAVKRVTLADLGSALREGFRDWRTCRTDVLVMVVLYPLAALFLAGVIVDKALFPFIFPICAGFALVGPLATLWFTALSRQLELDGVASSEAASEIFDERRIGPIQRLAVMLILLFIAWVAVAGIVYGATLGVSDEGAGAGFFTRVFTTGAGYEMIAVGCLIGAVFALVALGLGLVSFSMTLDRSVTVREALSISIRAALHNPVFTLAWGGLIVAGFVIGAIPALLGLAVTIPVLGHTNWHIYRRLIG